MEEKLALRIRLFRESGQVRADVADFVRVELEALAEEGRSVTEETAGMLTSHLMMALNRAQNGESIEESPAEGDIAAELAEVPAAVEAAQQITARAERTLGASLPSSEVGFLALHLAVLDRRSPVGQAAPEHTDG
ncbi:PRD domain-containing protein [Streptomyces ovatisporus]|uniref:PRD domain-containing protein n=1 Tax=Streptomyces ovatisporus TaxID=1128682 RepID=A0ABV9A629_9ACTN